MKYTKCIFCIFSAYALCVPMLRGVRRRRPTNLRITAGSKEQETDDNADQAQHFFPWVFFFEHQNTVQERNDCAAASNGGDHGDERVCVAQSEHIDIVAQHQEYGYTRDSPCPMERDCGLCGRATQRAFAVSDECNNTHHKCLIESIIHLNCIMIKSAHHIFVV